MIKVGNVVTKLMGNDQPDQSLPPTEVQSRILGVALAALAVLVAALSISGIVFGGPAGMSFGIVGLAAAGFIGVAAYNAFKVADNKESAVVPRAMRYENGVILPGLFGPFFNALMD